MAQDFVRSCLNKNPTKRHTYSMLLAHPWMQPLSKPETITEDDEEASQDDDALASAAANLSIKASGDSDVAAWVAGVLDAKKKGLLGDGAAKPALHAAPLDSVSPVGSPMS
jgi:mitogen-activated protein kinase kinase